MKHPGREGDCVLYESVDQRYSFHREKKNCESLEHKASWEGMKSPRDVKKGRSVGH